MEETLPLRLMALVTPPLAAWAPAIRKRGLLFNTCACGPAAFTQPSAKTPRFPFSYIPETNPFQILTSVYFSSPFPS